MGNSKSASFQIEHLPNGMKEKEQPRERFSFSQVHEEHVRDPQLTASLYSSVYAESSTSEFSKESETMSTLSSTSTTENIPAFKRSKTPPMVIPTVVEPEPETHTPMRRRSKTWNPDSSHFDSFFDQIVETIEQEAGKKSPTPSRRTMSSRERPATKKKWSSMFS